MLYWLMETATTSCEEHVASPPKVSKAKEIPKKGQKAAPKLVARKRVISQKASALCGEGAMASNSDLKRMVGLGLMKILVSQMYIDLRDLAKTTQI